MHNRSLKSKPFFFFYPFLRFPPVLRVHRQKGINNFLIEKREKTGMEDVDRAVRIPLLDDTRDVNLART